LGGHQGLWSYVKTNQEIQTAVRPPSTESCAPWMYRASSLTRKVTAAAISSGRQMRAFVVVEEEGGLSAAARRLHLSQSALSQIVQSLERQLGVQLLSSSHSGTTPTAAGEMLVRRARAILAEHDQAVADVMALGNNGSTVAGRIRVGVPLELPLDVLPSALTELRALHPATQVDVRHASSARQLAAVESGDLDLALVRYRPAGDRFDALLVVREPIGVLLDAERALALAEPSGVPLERLAGMGWLGFPPLGRAGAGAERERADADGLYRDRHRVDPLSRVLGRERAGSSRIEQLREPLRILPFLRREE
jgi:DNA-binding transcriptional LysR family regulator